VNSAEREGVERSTERRCGQKNRSKKRRILVDASGLMFDAIVPPLGVRDCDGGRPVLNTLVGHAAFLSKLFVNGGCQDRCSPEPRSRQIRDRRPKS
jgi:hypothetical protein